ncbi:helix-turn-helix transcriptional regulator [Roseibium aggregatum]|uniref:S24 family peptidase n=1 Tax=Roseibium aggregatum TaxID=187304 RepID=UPI001E36FA96|nr:helix-turn-helix transcriptional regulator [Roseibium aggregatum]UES56620.1 helix-turn-helix transcriptional regulator [Roseibium aggregatum]
MSERYLFLSRQYGETAAVLSHEKVWAAIDALASQNGLSPSGLARRAGLDPTAFNPSKRVAGDGRPRWPSTESLAKVLAATGEALNTFAARVETPGGPTDAAPALVPLAGLDAASDRNAFDSAGRPAGANWQSFSFPQIGAAFALQVSNEDFYPLYRNGDIVVVAPGAPLRTGDRLAIKLNSGRLSLYTLQETGDEDLAVCTIGDNSQSVRFQHSAIEWTARIIWASQ